MKPTADKRTHLSLDGLESGQSVRTTFRFSEKAEDALDRLSKTTKVTKKDILDRFARLVLKDDALTAMLIKEAKEAATVTVGQDLGDRKTWVLTKAALTLIKSTAQKTGMSRDALAESLVLFADALIKAANQQRPKKHKEAQKVIENFQRHAEQIEDQLGELLGEDDPIYMRFGFVVTILMNLSMAIEAEMEKGTPIDPDDMSQQGL